MLFRIYEFGNRTWAVGVMEKKWDRRESTCPEVRVPLFAWHKGKHFSTDAFCCPAHGAGGLHQFALSFVGLAIAVRKI